jgi:hypothetical protein
VAASYSDANVIAIRSTPQSQCAAVRKTVGEMSVPEQDAQVPSG